ncbi:TetR/AcrR family transcriptional regulator [Streptomyces sp. TS71-3]|uniref:TetR/AcrR family transcriptional regulator n=1 Tax=Streptomyces sp. TS71-3 TaxID=2733862 RepID=UPI001B2EDB8A|nr:TetR/AcrR family transcriptional regulator [Streptomyces sp. TS71-3]GHJ40138.1 TetR family transcriptional regulator [Streptomyces sp. TS71-3]
MARAADRTKRPPRASVWLDVRASRGGAGRRSDQPSGLDRDRITEATVRLLDAEGLARFSMRRLAAELNVTAMSVYWYVDTKEDLLELALDAAFGELSLPSGGAAEDWPGQLRVLAGEYRALLVRHPWLSPLAGRFLNIGPNSVELSATLRRVVRGTGLSPGAQAGALSAVFQFVYGFGTIEGHFIQRCAEAGMTQDEYVHEAMNSIAARPEVAGAVREPAELAGTHGEGTVEEMRESDFSFALDVLIAGIEAMVARE